ncbi:MAG: hypothetical protein ACI398_10930 [Clostridium sp.]
MYINNNKNSNSFLIDMFFLVVKFITDRNKHLNLTVCTSKNIENTQKYDDEAFFKAGQFLMFLYVFSVDNLYKKNINYLDGTFFVKLSDENFNLVSSIKTKSESIANHIINRSVYTKQLLPHNCSIRDLSNNKNLSNFQRGFKICYETFLNEKIDLIKLLKNDGLINIYFNLIKNIRLLSPHDLKIQLEFINIQVKKSLTKNSIVEKIIRIKDDKNTFINLSLKLLDLVTENSIIGINDSGAIELTWIKYSNNKLGSIGTDSIYIAIYFAYIGKVTNNSYYSQSAKQSLTPLFNMSISDYKQTTNLDKILKSMYLLNNYINYSELNDFIYNNQDLFMMVSASYKKECNLKTDELIFQCIMDNSMDVLNSIILV